MKHASITLPQDLWEYLDTVAAKLKTSRAGAAAHVIREHKNDRLMERVEALEKLGAQLEKDLIRMADYLPENRWRMAVFP